MYQKQRIIFLIPARGGSKGLPGKNILSLEGRPLIGWTIRQCLEADLADRILVSTDDEEIARISMAEGAEVPFLRPAEHARDESPTLDAVLHALDWFEARGERFDFLGLFEPTSPLRKTGDICLGMKNLIEQSLSADAIVSVGKIHLENPFVCKTLQNGYLKPLLEPLSNQIHQRQQYPDVYFPYGVIYAIKVETLRQQRTFYPPKTLAFPIERWQNYEIDDQIDFLCVERVFSMMKTKIAGVFNEKEG
jgi:CMP-N-acetylneuraminic acid synthetase